MTTAIGHARTYTDILEADQDGPYIFSRIFSDEGWRSRSRSKKKFRLLKRIEPALTPMLREGERVFFLTKGVTSLSLIEWWLFGMALYYLNRRAIVLTTQRVLLLQINSRDKPRELKSHVEWPAIAKLKSTLFGTTQVELRSGKHLNLTGIQRADRKWLKSVMNEVIDKLEATSESLGAEELCPHCYEPVSLGVAKCDACEGLLKSPRHATTLSLIFPGAGDLYLGHWGFAALELFVSFAIWLGIISLAINPSFSVAYVLMFAAFMIVIYHGVDAFATRRIALKGAYPAKDTNITWHFFGAAAMPTMALVILLVSAGGKLDLRPLDTLIASDEIPPDYITALRNDNVISPDETIHYFYSKGVVTILEDGNLFTDDRIISYAFPAEGAEVYTTTFQQVADLHLFPAQDQTEPNVIQVVPERGQAYHLFAPDDPEEADLFMSALLERWRTVRNDYGVGTWFDGGMGYGFDDAVLIRGLPSVDSSEVAEQWWLTLWFGQEGVDWKITNRARYEMGGRLFEQVHVQGSAGGQRQVMFDVGQAGDAR